MNMRQLADSDITFIANTLFSGCVLKVGDDFGYSRFGVAAGL